MNTGYEKLEKCYQDFLKKIDFEPKVALILGSGLGNYGSQIEIKATLDYSEIEGFPVSTVSGHVGRFLFGYVGQTPVVCMQGRVHYYEGYSMEEVVLPTRLMHMMGADKLLITNAAGGINCSFQTGDFMLIQDHISCFVPNPLIGQNMDQLGDRFPDMSQVYCKELQEKIVKVAMKNGIPLQKGVYVQLTGPSFETPQEIRMLRTLGGDAVGMSTVCEAIAANHCGMKVAGISFISNQAAGITQEPLSDLDVKEAAAQVEESFTKLITESIKAMEE